MEGIAVLLLVGFFVLSKSASTVAGPGQSSTYAQRPQTNGVPPIVNKVANGAGKVAGYAGTAIASKYVGPLGAAVGKQASIDTAYNVRSGYKTTAAIATDLRHGNVTGAVKAGVVGGAEVAVQPLKTSYNIAKSGVKSALSYVGL